MEKISVIVPVYRVEKYLKQCLDSIVEQTYRNLEIILVDDGSPDQCGNICDSYAKRDARIKVIHKKNEGLSAARNDGIKAATSDWLLFVDSDDWIDRDYVQKLHDPGADKYDITICGAMCEIRPGVWKRRFGIEGQTDIVTDRAMLDIIWANSMPVHYNPLDNGIKIDIIAPLWNKLYNRGLILEKGIFFGKGCKVYEDTVFNLEYLRWVRKVHICSQYGYHYRYAQGGITRSFDPERIEKDRTALKIIKEFSKDAGNSYLEKFLNAHICIIFLLNLSRYYFSRYNPDSLYEKIKTIKRTLCEDMYQTAFAKADRGAFNKYQNIAIYFARRQWAAGLALLTKLNVIRNELKNKISR